MEGGHQMARWNVRIKKKLKIGQNQLEEGLYINTDVLDSFVSWLRAQKFKEPMTDELKETLLSPDGEWVISFRQTTKDYVFVQLANFRSRESLSEGAGEIPEEMERRDEGDGESESV